MTEQVEQMRLSALSPYDDNPRQGDVGAIAVSLERNGQYRPIVVNRRDMSILAGNHTWRAAKSLGWDTIAATFVDVDEATARRIVLVDNRANDLASYDDRVLADLLSLIHEEEGPDGLVGTGFDGGDLDELLAELDAQQLPDALNDPDEVPEPPAEPVSNLGDVWLCGEHRVVCGDSAAGTGIADVMADDRAAMVWTDPPYGVDVQERDMQQAEVRGRRKDGKGVQNDDLKGDKLTDFLTGALGTAYAHSNPGASWYVCSPAGDLLGVFGNVLAGLDGTWRHTLVWVKDQFVMGRADYHYRHEMVFYGWVPGAAHTWESDRKQDSILEFPRPRRSEEHPTMKPVELIEYCIGNSSKRGAIVLDPFGGSGSTLIAAHRTGRVARLVELDPSYVDVICRRWQEHTGVKPVLESTGEPYDFASA